MNMAAFWNIPPCSLVEVYRCFSGVYPPLKRPQTRLHGDISQKAVIFRLLASQKAVYPIQLVQLLSSLSMVCDYRLDDRGSISGRGKWFFFSSICVQTSSEAHPAYYPMCTAGPFPGGKHGRGVTLSTQPHLMPRSRMNKNNTTSYPWRLHGGSGQLHSNFSDKAHALGSSITRTENTE
jgi:hypothetical protein